MTEREAVQQASDAQRLLDNPAFRLALTKLKDHAARQMKECSIRDAQGQVLCLQFAKMTDIFEQLLTGVIETGKLADHRLQMDRLRNESAGQRLRRKISG